MIIRRSSRRLVLLMPLTYPHLFRACGKLLSEPKSIVRAITEGSMGYQKVPEIAVRSDVLREATLTTIVTRDVERRLRLLANAAKESLLEPPRRTHDNDREGILREYFQQMVALNDEKLPRLIGDILDSFHLQGFDSDTTLRVEAFQGQLDYLLDALDRAKSYSISPTTIEAIEWVTIPLTPDVQDKIGTIIQLIDDVTKHLTNSNLLDDERTLTEIERAQLIAILETALHILRSPLIEKGLFEKAAELLRRAGRKATEKQIELAFGAAAGALGTAIIQFLSRL